MHPYRFTLVGACVVGDGITMRIVAQHIGYQETRDGDSFALFTILEGPRKGSTVSLDTLYEILGIDPPCGHCEQDVNNDHLCPECQERFEKWAEDEQQKDEDTAWPKDGEYCPDCGWEMNHDVSCKYYG